MGGSLRHSQLQYARPDNEVANWPRANPDQDALRLLDVVRAVKPTVLIGTSTHSRSFTKELIQEMASHVERPIIFPMSNPFVFVPFSSFSPSLVFFFSLSLHCCLLIRLRRQWIAYTIVPVLSRWLDCRTSLAEVDPADAFEWTDGKALLATGSPFPPCILPNGKQYVVAQTNVSSPFLPSHLPPLDSAPVLMDVSAS
jgi:malate dehydrogenase (oxaloacetate-decarboxylating)